MQSYVSPIRPVKHELSPTPPPPARRSACQGTKRFAPFPSDCHPSNPNFKRNRQLWAQLKLKEIQKLGLQKEKLLIRDDGVTIDWSSPVPVWTDTLTPDYSSSALLEHGQSSHEAASAHDGKRLRLEEHRPLTPPPSTSSLITSPSDPSPSLSISPKRKLPVPPRPSTYRKKAGSSSSQSPSHPDERPKPGSAAVTIASASPLQLTSASPPVMNIVPPPAFSQIQDQPATHIVSAPQPAPSASPVPEVTPVVLRSSMDASPSTPSSRSATSGSLPQSARRPQSSLYGSFPSPAARKSLLPPPTSTREKQWPPSIYPFTSSHVASSNSSQSGFRVPPKAPQSTLTDTYKRYPSHTPPHVEPQLRDTLPRGQTQEHPAHTEEESDDEIQIIEKPVRPTSDGPKTSAVKASQTPHGKLYQPAPPSSQPGSVETTTSLPSALRSPAEVGRLDAFRPIAPQASSSSIRDANSPDASSARINRGDPRFDFTLPSPPPPPPLSSLPPRLASPPSPPLPHHSSSPLSLPLFLPSPSPRHSSSPATRELSPSPAEDELWTLTEDYITRYTHAYNDDRATLALAYAHNATFSYRFVPSSPSASSLSPFYSSGVSKNIRTSPSEVKTSRLDIVSALLGLLSSHKFQFQTPGRAAMPLEYDWRFLGEKGALFVAYADLAPPEKDAENKDGLCLHMMNSFVLRKKDHDAEDASSDVLWPLVAVSHHITFIKPAGP